MSGQRSFVSVDRWNSMNSRGLVRTFLDICGKFVFSSLPEWNLLQSPHLPPDVWLLSGPGGGRRAHPPATRGDGDWPGSVTERESLKISKSTPTLSSQSPFSYLPYPLPPPFDQFFFSFFVFLLFQVGDKRVSRHHGLLENLNGRLRLKPARPDIHTNIPHISNVNSRVLQTQGFESAVWRWNFFYQLWCSRLPEPKSLFLLFFRLPATFDLGGHWH